MIELCFELQLGFLLHPCFFAIPQLGWQLLNPRSFLHDMELETTHQWVPTWVLKTSTLVPMLVLSKGEEGS
jgi:hypothetical protein